MAVSFRQTRVNKPDEDDLKKLTRVVKYLRGTRDMILTLGLQNDGVMTWWVDASYAVHNDMKGHTGGTMSLGHGSIYSSSTKQKLVSCSSTEAKLIGVYDILPQLMWTSNFMRAQGMNLRKVVLMQDNTSTILLENSGCTSSTKQTKHIDIRYFYIKEKVDSKDVIVEYCPTEHMWADFFTKPLHGNLLKWLWSQIMGFDRSSPYYTQITGVCCGMRNSPTPPSVTEVWTGYRIPVTKSIILDTRSESFF